MTCQSCGHEIADNAIVCYRCGAPTAIPAAPDRNPAARAGAGLSRLVIVIVIIVVVVAAAVALSFGWHLL